MTQLELEQELCRKSFKFFLGYCFKHVYKSQFNFYQFHNKLIEILTSIQPNDRIIINAPPRIGKTEILKHFMAWKLFLDPAATMLYISYDQSLVGRKSNEIKDIIRWLYKRFNLPNLKIRSDVDGKLEWRTAGTGGIISRGSGNAVTGAGANCLLIVDDPNKPSDRSSATILERRNTVFSSTIRNRIDMPDVPIIICQQRVANKDLSGFLLGGGTNDRWKHISMPAINEDGTALCDERLPLSEIENYKSDPFTYHAQYLQTPLDEIGRLFKKDKIVIGQKKPPINAMRIVHSIDSATKGEIGNDFNCIATIGFDGINYHILDVDNFRADITVLLEKCRQLRHRWPEVPFLFEGRANGSAAVQILRAEMNSIFETMPCKDKVERAIAIKYLFDSDNVFFYTHGLIFGEIVGQFQSFPHVKHDDIVDAICQGIAWLKNNAVDTVAVQTSALDLRLLQRPSLKRYT